MNSSVSLFRRSIIGISTLKLCYLTSTIVSRQGTVIVLTTESSDISRLWSSANSRVIAGEQRQRQLGINLSPCHGPWLNKNGSFVETRRPIIVVFEKWACEGSDTNSVGECPTAGLARIVLYLGADLADLQLWEHVCYCYMYMYALLAYKFNVLQFAIKAYSERMNRLHIDLDGSTPCYYTSLCLY